MQPSLDRFGTLTLDGSRYLAPKFVSSPKPPQFLEAEESTELKELRQELNHICRSGKCKHAHGIVCRCHCKGAMHRIAMLREYHSIEEYGANGPAPLGVYL